MRGKKGEEHFNWWDPPRRRANKRRGHGTFANDRPPVMGTVGRESGQVRLRVRLDTQGTTCTSHVYAFTRQLATVYTDEWSGYNGIGSTWLSGRFHHTVCHAAREWARDEDGDGVREVHTNTLEGLWATIRTFLRPFRGVHKCYLSGYIAICEWRINLKRISPPFICALVARLHPFYT